MITGLDARQLVVLCTLPGCAIPPKVSITSPANLSLSRISPIIVRGGIAETVEQVTVNGIPATLDGTTWTATVPLPQEEKNSITAVATDAAGNQGTATIQVLRDTTPPNLAITSPANGSVLDDAQPSISVSYGDLHGVDTGTLAFTANGSALAVACTLTQTGGSCTPTGPLPAGPVTIIASVADNAGNTTSDQVVFTIGPAAITVTISEPVEGAILTGSPITVRGTVSDPDAPLLVQNVFATGKGTTYAVGGIVLAEGLNSLTVRARDALGQEAIATRAVILDTQPPVLEIVSPADRSIVSEPLVTLVGTVRDGTPVTATVNGAPVPVSGGNLVTGVDLIPGPNLVTVVATDAAGHVATKQRTVYLDPSPLFVTGVVPPGGASDVSVTTAVTVSFSEPVRAGSLTPSSFLLQAGSGVLPAALAVAPDGLAATLVPSTDLPPGTPVQVSVTAGVTDLSGNRLIDAFGSTFTTAGEPVESTFVVGEAYDDSRSLPLAGASVVAVDPATSQVLAQSETDERGRYFLSAVSGAALIQVSKAGFTRVERSVVGVDAALAEILDARLTPLSSPHPVQAVFAAEIESGAGDRLEIPPGAFESDGMVIVTPVGPQGPRIAFPAGWTPVSIVEVTAPEAFDPPATLCMPDRSGLAAGRSAVLAEYDPGSVSWIARATVTLPAAGGVECGQVTGAGQFSLLIPDEGDGAPALPAVDAPLVAAPSIPIPPDARGTGRVTPPVGLISDPTAAHATVEIGADVPLRSSTPIAGDFLEQFLLRAGGPAAPLSSAQDLFAYRSLEDPSGRTLSATFLIAPSRVYSPLEASEGRITVSLLERPSRVREVIGADGGGARTGDGSLLLVPPGAFVTDTPVELARIFQRDPRQDRVRGLTFLGGLELDLGGTVPATEVTLVLGDAASRVSTGRQVVVARMDASRGETLLVPVALARIDGDDLVTTSAASGVALPGIREGGRYGFYLVDVAVEVVTGTARDEAGRRDGLVVRIDGLPFASLTDAGGRFTLLAPPGKFSVLATSASTLDEARIEGTTGTPLPEMVVTTTPPRVERVTVRPPPVAGNFAGPVVLLGVPAPIIDDDASGESNGNADGRIDAGERVELSLSLRNEGNVSVDGGLFALEARSDSLRITPQAVPNAGLPPDEPVLVGPFVFDVPVGIDPASLRYRLTYFSEERTASEAFLFALPLDVEHFGVSMASQVTVDFSEPVVAASLNDGLYLERREGQTFQRIATKLLVAASGSTASLRPLSPLENDTLYRITISDGVVDRDGLALNQAPVVEQFRTRDLEPPAPIDPGKIEASIPDDDGFVSVTGTLGSANPDDTIVVLNENTGFVVVATVAADGSFAARIPAETTERLQLISIDPSGNERTIDVGGFVRRDPVTGDVLSVVVGRDGAVVEGPDGIALEVPTGAVQGSAEISVSRSDALFALPDDLAGDAEVVAAFEALFTVVDRIQIEADLPRFAAPVALSLPAPVGAQEGDMFVVARMRDVTIGGPLADLDRITGLTAAENPLRTVERLEILDSATVKIEGTRLVLSTDSPPFPGILEPGTLTLLEPGRDVTFMAGEVRRDTIAGSPVAGAVVRTLPSARETSALAAVTDAEGQFIVVAGDLGGPYANGAVIASRLDVFDPDFQRVIRRDARGRVALPAPPGTVVAHLEQPFALPTNLPAAVIDVLGDLEPPSLEILLAGSSLGRGYAAVGDDLKISVVAADDDEVTFVGLEVDLGGGLQAAPLAPDATLETTPTAPGLIRFRARAQDRTGNTTFSEASLLVLVIGSNGAVVPPASDPARTPDVIEPPGTDEPIAGRAPKFETPFDADLLVCFSEPLDPNTIDDSTVELLDPEGQGVAIDITTEFGDSCIRLAPIAYLRMGATYEARITGGEAGVRSRDGDRIGDVRKKPFVPSPIQVATITTASLPDGSEIGLNALDLGLIEDDILVVSDHPFGNEGRGSLRVFRVRDEEDPSLLQIDPPVIATFEANGMPRSLAIDGSLLFVGNRYLGDVATKSAILAPYQPGTTGLPDVTLSCSTPSFVTSIPIFSTQQTCTGLQFVTDSFPSPPSNLQVFDLRDPSAPAFAGASVVNRLENFIWNPNTWVSRVELTPQGIGVVNFLENIEVFTATAPPASLGLIDRVYGFSQEPGRCGGEPRGDLCVLDTFFPLLASVPTGFAQRGKECLETEPCTETDEFTDAAFFDGFAATLERQGLRIVSTTPSDLTDLLAEGTRSFHPMPGAGTFVGRIGGVPRFEWWDEDDVRHETDLAFVAGTSDRRLRVFDVTNPDEEPKELSTLADTFGNMSFDACRGLAYLHGTEGEFHVIDFNDPRVLRDLNDPGDGRDPFEVSDLGPTLSFNGNASRNHMTYVASEGGVASILSRVCMDPPLVSIDGRAVVSACPAEELPHPERSACAELEIRAYNELGESYSTRRLAVAKWEHAFDDGGEPDLSGDPDRFYLSVRDHAREGLGKVIVELSTDSPGWDYDDDPTQIELLETEPGVFASSDLVLVSDRVDDFFPGSVDDVLNDTTHIVALGGEVEARYVTEADKTIKKQAVVPVLKTVTVDTFILRDAPAGAPAVEPADVEEAFRIANERYAQVGILIEHPDPVIIDPPEGVDLSDGLRPYDGGGIYDADGNAVKDESGNPRLWEIISPEGRALLELGTPGEISDLHVFYVPAIINLFGRSLAGTSINDCFPTPGGIANGQEWEVDERGNSFVADPPDRHAFVVPHELAHILIESPRVVSPRERTQVDCLGHKLPPDGGAAPRWNMQIEQAGALGKTNTPTAAKRLTEEQGVLMRGSRHAEDPE